jgi:homoserine kinase type II
MQSLICCACSNGCALILERQDAQTVFIDGQACTRGVAYAYSQWHEREPGKYIPKTRQPYDKTYLGPLLYLFGHTLKEIISGISIQGSPDRSLFRTVIRTADSYNFILEEIHSTEIIKRRRIIKNLDYLAKRGLPVVQYVGHTVQEYDDKYWQLSPYISGVPLDREIYWQESWRGTAVADFLADLYREAVALDRSGQDFSLQKYLEELWQTLSLQRSELWKELQPVVEFLRQNFFPRYTEIPLGFCHGDPHPLNMLWGETQITAVIDWEFSGIKPILYDAALIIGCVGVEHFTAYNSGFITGFKDQLQARRVFMPEVLAILPMFTLALRFAWLSEWLRRNDLEMLEFEVQYMQLLLQRI